MVSTAAIAAISSFDVGFTVFVVATAVLIVLTLRFTFQRSQVGQRKGDESMEAEASGEADDEDDSEEDRGITALVLGGGGTRGAVQIGMLQVLTEHGFRPDRIYGASVGAVNGAVFAGDPTRRGVERMTEIWRGLTRDDVYPQGRFHGPWLYFQQRESVYPNAGLRKVIEDGVDFERLEEAEVPVEVVATSLVDGHARWFTYGPAADAVLASTAVPGIFPPVEIDGERYIDGGVVDNVPLLRAVDSGATRIVVLLCGPPVYTPGTAKRPVEALLNAFFLSIHSRFARDLASLPEGVEVVVCSGRSSETHDFVDFSATESLIAEGRAEASEVLRRHGLGAVGAPEGMTPAAPAAPPPPPAAAPSPPAPAPPPPPAPAPPAPPTPEPARSSRSNGIRSNGRRRSKASGTPSAPSATPAASPDTASGPQSVPEVASVATEDPLAPTQPTPGT
jgi:NTE family protein